MKTQRLKYHVSIPGLLDIIRRDSATSALCRRDMHTREQLGESQSSVEKSELAGRCRTAEDGVRQAHKDMLTLFDETQDVPLTCYRALKAERDDLLAALEELLDQALSREPLVLDEVTIAWRTARIAVDTANKAGGAK